MRRYRETMRNQIGPAWAILLIVSSCSDRGPVEPAEPPPEVRPAALIVVEGDDQVGVADALLPDSLVIRVVDEHGNAMSGIMVQWGVTAGTGSVSAATTQTDAAGASATAWRLGSTLGTVQEVRATVGEMAAVFHATAELPSGLALRTEGDRQVARVSTALSDSLLVEIVDGSGTPVPDAGVTWHVIGGGGALTAATTATDSRGRATASWTLGPEKGAQQVEARVVLSTGTVVASAAFAATATLVDPVSVVGELNAVADRIALSLADETAVDALRLAGGTTASAAVHGESDPPELTCINMFGEPSVVFQQSQLGRTYEWDATAGLYVAGTGMNAPECAIRITIYAIDPATEEPVVPLAPLGYLEVTDLGSTNLAGGHWRLGIERVVALPGGALQRTASYVISRGTSYYQSGSNTSTSGFEGSFGPDPELSVTHSYSSTYHRTMPSTFQRRLSFAFQTDSLVAQRSSSVYTVRVRTDAGAVEIDVFAGVIEWRDPTGAVDTVALCTCSTEALTFTNALGGSLDPAVEAGLRDFWGALQNRFGLEVWPQFTEGGILTP